MRLLGRKVGNDGCWVGEMLCCVVGERYQGGREVDDGSAVG
jgi:hypothetical protein